MEIRTYLKKHTLLFDGAMGTYFAASHRRSAGTCEEANLQAPEQIAAIHREYLAAGCRAIKTNTFALSPAALGTDRCRELLEAGFRLARDAAGDAAFVFADMGPVLPMEGADAAAEYRFLADCFLDLGATHFLFETQSRDTGLRETAAYIKERCPGAFILTSFAPKPDGFTEAGIPVRELLGRAEADEHVDALGLNCISSARHMAVLVDSLGPLKKPLSVMPNAGYPTVLGERTAYDGDPEYFAMQLSELRGRGVQILGGCCGTTPAHLALAARALQGPAPGRVAVSKKPVEAERTQQESRFYAALCDPNQKPFAVELDPPEGTDAEKFIAGARELRDGGAGIITIADCPIARARMDSSLLACKLRRELGMEALPHMTCRDRNLNATKALLLGLSAEGVHHVLAVTGDPIPSARRDEVKSVYNFNSRMLAKYITSLNETVLSTPFRVFGALNLNAVNFRVQLELAKEKEENGICGFLTQPVLTERALENLELAKKTLEGKILGGIIPVVSERNALFMNSEVAGITVDPEIVRLYRGLDREQGEELAIRISRAVAREMSPYVDGYYLMTPFGRTGLMVRIMNAILENQAVETEA